MSARISRRALGRTTGHARQPATEVEAFTLTAEDALTVVVWTYGASLMEVWAPDRAGAAVNVVAGAADLAAAERTLYLGSTLGRYARCVPGAELVLDGKTYALSANEGRNHVHGGAFGFDRYVWNAEAAHVDGGAGVRLWLERPDGDEGYPGAVHAETTYTLRGTTLTFEHRATTTRPTVVAMTNHAYWNLAGGGRVDEHALTVHAKRVVLVDDELMPLAGPPADVAGTGLDLRASRRLGAIELDHCYLLRGGPVAAELVHEASGRRLEVRTTEPGLQLYTADHLGRVGLSLQTGALPGSATRPDFPSSRLDPGGVYVHRTEHHFECR